MSASAARMLPEHVSLPTRSTEPRHIEVVATRSQRRARPKLAYSLIIIAGLFAVLATQLLLSIALADGAYQISALQAQQKELSRAQQSVTEELGVLGSPQNLAARAESLGLVSNTSAVYLNLANGAVMGSPTAAREGDGSVVGTNGSLLIANSLLDGVPTTMTPVDKTPVNPGAPDSQPDSGSVASTPTGIPGPSTR